MRKLNLIILLCGILFLCYGCITSSEFNYVEREIKKQIYPIRVKTNFKFSFGPISLSTASLSNLQIHRDTRLYGATSSLPTPSHRRTMKWTLKYAMIRITAICLKKH